MIRSKGLFPTRVVDADGGGAAAGGKKKVVQASVEAKVEGKGLGTQLNLGRFFKPRVKPKQLMTYTRQLATLVDAGLPLLKGLKILLKQEKNTTLRDAINGMGEAVEG